MAGSIRFEVPSTIEYFFFRNDCDLCICPAFSFPERRTIIRQDERPAYFYIVLSGSAIPTYKSDGASSAATLDVLERGSTFGVHISLVQLGNYGSYF